jgi:hypothetical protein
MHRRTFHQIVFLAFAALLPGCAGKNVAPPPPTQTPAVESPRAFSDSSSGISLAWPAGWDKHNGNDYILILVPSGAKDASQSISLDVPKLPFHLRGMIPIGRVRDGYLDDLRKQKGKIETQDLPPRNIPDAKVSFVHSSWDSGGAKISEMALLIVHDDHVYIVRADSDAAHEQAVRTAFDQVVNSLKWTPARASASD